MKVIVNLIPQSDMRAFRVYVEDEFFGNLSLSDVNNSIETQARLLEEETIPERVANIEALQMKLVCIREEMKRAR